MNAREMDRGLRIVTGIIGVVAGMAIGAGFAEGHLFAFMIGGSIGLTGLVLRYSLGLE